MHILRASRQGVSWALSIVPSADPGCAENSGLLQALERGRRALRLEYSRTEARLDEWQLEWIKGALGQGEIALGLACQLADACVSGNDTVYEVEAPLGHLSIRTAAWALRARGCRVSGASVQAIRDRLWFLAASLAGFFGVLLSLARGFRGSGSLPSKASIYFAVHGEWTNRTRHLLSLCATGSRPGAILVLGRPRCSLEKLRTDWQARLGVELPALVRPWSASAAIASVPAQAAMFRKGFSGISRQAYLPSFRETSAQCYRCLLGQISAAWWRQQNVRVDRIAYGHTGVADTTLLELAQHADAIKTIHVVHGLSSGLNFVGRSTVALWRCGFDARWHDRLGGYGSNLFEETSPPPRATGQDLLLLTNFAHPMNPWFQIRGIKDEAQVLQEVANAARELGDPGLRLVWRPHPAFETLPERDRIALETLSAKLGYQRLGGSLGADQFRGARLVLCTPSSVAVDALAAGVRPLVLAWQGMDPDCAIAQLPSCSDPGRLGEALSKHTREGSEEAHYVDAWRHLAPGAVLDNETLERL